MTTFARLSLAKKLVLLATTTSLITLIIASIAWIGNAWVSGRDSQAQEINTLGQLIADRSNAALAFGDHTLASQNLATLANLPNILSACIYNEENQLFAAYRKSGTSAPPCHDRMTESETIAENESIVNPIPIRLEERTIGKLLIRSDLSRVIRQVQHDLLSVVTILLISGLVAFMIAARLQRVISEPVRQLARTAREVAEHHNYQVRAEQQAGGELGALVDAFNDMLDTIEQQNRSLQHSRDQLETLVEKRTGELRASNRELEAFCYSVSHDLRAPLRSINGFSQALLEDYDELLDDNGRDYLHRVVRSADNMSKLIDDLLSLSRVARSQLAPKRIDVSSLVKEIAEDIRTGAEYRGDVEIQPGISAYGDPTLLRALLANLLENAFKYSSKTEHPHIRFGCDRRNGRDIYWVRDNGAGFDMKYAHKLFGAFQRLHRDEEFEGTGIGLASVARVVHRHGGEVWAESEIGKGASFYFTLDPDNIDSAASDLST